MRSNKELLQIYLDNKHLFSDGLCSWTDVLYVGLITDEERRYLKSIIFNNRPKIGFLQKIGLSYTSKYKVLPSNRSYYWTIGAIEPRIKFLKKYLK